MRMRDTMGEAEAGEGGRGSIYLGVGVLFIAFAIVLLIYFFGTLHLDALMVSLVFFVLGSLFSVQGTRARAAQAGRNRPGGGADG